MNQSRIDFKLNFNFFKNCTNNNYIYFYKYYNQPIEYINYLYLGSEYADDIWFNKYIFRKLVEVNNDEFFFEARNFKKIIKCKKILIKKKYFVNLLYF